MIQTKVPIPDLSGSSWDDLNEVDIFLSCSSDESENFQDDSPLAEVQIANEMAAMSTHEREKVYHDIHGVSGKIEETPSMLREILQRLEEELSTSTTSSQSEFSAYKIALGQNAAYVHNPQFQLPFLRADRFEVKAAARRIISHFDWKQRLFGDVLLTRDIQIEDLGQEDLDTFYNFPLYFLPMKDSVGRPVVVYKGLDLKYPLQSFLRKCFYLSMVVAEDEDSQQNGGVFLSYLVGQTFSISDFVRRRDANRSFGEVLAALPMRVDVFHFCFDSITWRPFIAIFKLATCTFQRLRCREHYGNDKEVRFSLQTFGIPMEFVEASIVSSDANAKFWRRRHELEQQRRNILGSAVTVVELPNRLDVLLGRGSSCYNHFGNVRLRNLVEEHLEQYTASRVIAKTTLTGEIVRQIKTTGKFLRDCGYGWVEVDDEAAHKKVAHAFRTLRGLKAISTKGDIAKGLGGSTNNGHETRKRERDVET